MERDGKKVDRRVLYTKMFLKESLLTLMKEKPLRKITPTELCRHADINRNTFYSHYDSPEALLHSIEEELYLQIRSSVERSMQNGSIPALLTEICQAICDNRELCSTLFSEFGDKAFLRRIIELAHDISIAQWKAAGMREDDSMAEMYYDYSVSGSVAVIQRWITGGMKENPQTIALFIEKASFNGLKGLLS